MFKKIHSYRKAYSILNHFILTKRRKTKKLLYIKYKFRFIRPTVRRLNKIRRILFLQIQSWKSYVLRKIRRFLNILLRVRMILTVLKKQSFQIKSELFSKYKIKIFKFLFYIVQIIKIYFTFYTRKLLVFKRNWQQLRRIWALVHTEYLFCKNVINKTYRLKRWSIKFVGLI